MKTNAVLAIFLLLVSSAKGHAEVTFDWATVGNPGNGPDNTRRGAVPYVYRISKHEVTNVQYVEFLNAVDPTGVNSLGLYHEGMTSSGPGGVVLTPSAEDGSKYELKSNRENNPVNFVSFLDAMRFVNWLENGQGSGTTESGVYTIGRDALREIRDPNATYFIPSEDEWYKAAYHKNDGVTSNYWDYPTSTDAVPFSSPPPGNDPNQSNSANFATHDDKFAVTGSSTLNFSQNYLTDVGAYTEAVSAYGTFDQGGNVYEWNEFVDGSNRGLRGGTWWAYVEPLSASMSSGANPVLEGHGVGFRVASADAVGLLGDFDGDGQLTARDIDLLSVQIGVAPADLAFDVNSDGIVNLADHQHWVQSEDFAHTFIGDTNLDGEFNSGDVTVVFQAGEYEDNITLNSTWSEGDWNGDGDFDSGDLVAAFKDGGYEMGPRAAAVVTVPEPSGWILVMLSLLGFGRMRKR